MVKLQEADNQIVTDYEVYDQRPNDANLLIPAIEAHEAMLGELRTWWHAEAKGVKRVCIPNAACWYVG
jgi:IS5 family transposase